MEIPEFNKELRELTNDTCCGQSCLAVIEKKDMKQIFRDWMKQFGWYGYSKWKDLRKYLEDKGYVVKQITWNKLEIVNENSFYILRVQWIGKGEKKEKPFHGWRSWFEASANTHFIILNKDKIFCNELGIFNYDKLSDYLDGNGLITSALEIKQMENYAKG